MEEKIFDAMRRAGECNICFSGDLKRAISNAPQPRWVGADYASSSRRIIAVLINPGGGGPSATPLLAQEAVLFRQFHATGDYGPVRDYFRRQISQGNDWLCWYRDVLGLNLESISIINIAWCATLQNKYPRAMLWACYEKHTEGLLETLAPHVALLSGKATHHFQPFIKRAIPNVTIIPTLHYKHRKGKDAEKDEVTRVRGLIEKKDKD